MRGDYSPALRKTYPGLHCASNSAWYSPIQRRCGRKILAEGGNHRALVLWLRSRRDTCTIGFYFVIAVKHFCIAVTDCIGAIKKESIESRDIILCQGSVIGSECGFDLFDDSRVIDDRSGLGVRN